MRVQGIGCKNKQSKKTKAQLAAFVCVYVFMCICVDMCVLVSVHLRIFCVCTLRLCMSKCSCVHVFLCVYE